MTHKINDDIANEWLNSQKKTTKTAYRGIWVKFAEFTQMTGAEILASKKQDTTAAWEKRVLAFKAYMEQQGFATYTSTTAVMAIRGFFAYYRLPLQYRRSEGRRLRERRRKTEDYRFSLDDLRKLYEIANLQEKYVIVPGKSFGLRAGDFLKLTRGDLEPNIDKEPPISVGPINTEKESVQAFPFIDSDAKPIVKLMLEKMTREGRTQASEKMLKFSDEIQLTRVLKRCVVKAGINTGGRQVRFHCLRKFLTDRLSSIMSESKWKQIVGKTISEGAYVSPDSLREDYKRAMAETCFTKALTNEDATLLAQKEALKMIAKMQGIGEDQLGRIFKTRKTVTTQDEIAAMEKELMKDKADKNGNCEDGEHCQKIVSEENLAEFLTQGWRVVATLPSGKIVIDS